MNYHYIEYMLKERKEEEIKACQRARMLKAANYSGGGLAQRVWSAVMDTACQWMPEIKSRLMRCGYFVLHRKFATEPKGKSL